MDALKMVAVDRPRAANGSNDSSGPESDEITLAPRVAAALDALLEASEYAQDLGASAWDFSLEISSLRRLKLSNSDLRWLVVRGFVDHALEIASGDGLQRSFRTPKRLVFGKRSCFVLTPVGVALARRFHGVGEALDDDEARSAPSESGLDLVPPSRMPKWDRDRHELRVGSLVVKRFTIPSPAQEAILAAFDEKDWPARIDDPLPPRDGLSPKSRLQETINSLNQTLKRPLLQFFGDGSGQGILWEYRGEEGPSGSR
jgi:hypothetical protein